MKRAFLAAACVVALAGTAPAAAHAGVCRHRAYTIHQFIHFARAVLPSPAPRDERELRRIAHCMWAPRLRVVARRWWRDYVDPPGWAIPWYVVSCESGGRNLAPNGAGASGYYQIIPETWAAHGGLRFASEAYLASKRGQDIVARRIWVQDGASQWDCA